MLPFRVFWSFWSFLLFSHCLFRISFFVLFCFNFFHICEVIYQLSIFNFQNILLLSLHSFLWMYSISSFIYFIGDFGREWKETLVSNLSSLNKFKTFYFFKFTTYFIHCTLMVFGFPSVSTLLRFYGLKYPFSSGWNAFPHRHSLLCLLRCYSSLMAL